MQTLEAHAQVLAALTARTLRPPCAAPNAKWPTEPACLPARLCCVRPVCSLLILGAPPHVHLVHLPLCCPALCVCAAAQSYNTLLTLSHLVDVSDGIVLLQNEALHATAKRLHNIARPSFAVRRSKRLVHGRCRRGARPGRRRSR